MNKPPKESSGWNKKIPLEPCPTCRANGRDESGDNLYTLNDGAKWCFACAEISKEKSKWVKGNYYALQAPRGWLARGINLETAKKAGFKLGKYTGYLTNPKGEDGKREQVYVENEWVQIAEWFDAKGQLIAQKLRNKNKWFKFIGNAKDLDLWGINDYKPSDKIFIVITGGELDRLSVMQAQGLQYPVVSPPSGEGSAYKAIKKNLNILMEYKYVVLALDNDDAGRQAMEKAAELFEIHKVRMVKWPEKDPNELTKQGREKEIVKAVWDAKELGPDHVVTISDILPQILTQPKFGKPWPWEPLTEITYGIRFNEISIWVGPSGVGKTEIVKDIVSHVLEYCNCAVFSFEQTPDDTVRRYVGAKLGVKLQKPGELWDEEKIKDEALKFNGKLWLYDYPGTINTTDIIKSITYLAKAKNCRYFVIDNLKSLRIVFDKEACAEFAASLKALAKNLNVHIMLISHVSKNSIQQKTHVGFSSRMRVGEKPHENLSEDFIKKTMAKFQLDWGDGRMPSGSDIEGGNDMEATADYVFALARNKNSDNPATKRIINVKVLKAGRIDSEFGGRIFKLYREDNGLLTVWTDDRKGEIYDQDDIDNEDDSELESY